jgi:UDP-N-acetylmuramyl pentapeptide phosphotransferase/UDP-N-acetylglucosamine-1-phosphate transferase
MPALGILVLGLLSGVAIVPVLPALLKRLSLERTNYSGRPIYTGAGLVFILPALAAVLWYRDARAAPALAALTFGTLGLLDDLRGTPEFKGVRGHLRALRSGRLTTGFVKLTGGLCAAAALAWWLTGPHVAPAVTGTLLIALAANLFNLLDLRPLRALKLFWPASAALSAAGALALLPLQGASLPYARAEARRTLMLGDTGSNALGAALGTAAVQALPLWGQFAAVVLIAAFHLWAEKHSLSHWIDARPWASAIDGWGWKTGEPGPSNAGE